MTWGFERAIAASWVRGAGGAEGLLAQMVLATVAAAGGRVA